MIYIPGQFAGEVATAIDVHAKLSHLLDTGQVDSADVFMAQVLESKGRRIYEAVLAMVAASRGIPPKDVPR
jgi:DNA-binding phage protein